MGEEAGPQLRGDLRAQRGERALEELLFGRVLVGDPHRPVVRKRYLGKSFGIFVIGEQRGRLTQRGAPRLEKIRLNLRPSQLNQEVRTLDRHQRATSLDRGGEPRDRIDEGAQFDGTPAGRYTGADDGSDVRRPRPHLPVTRHLEHARLGGRRGAQHLGDLAVHTGTAGDAEML